ASGPQGASRRPLRSRQPRAAFTRRCARPNGVEASCDQPASADEEQRKHVPRWARPFGALWYQDRVRMTSEALRHLDEGKYIVEAGWQMETTVSRSGRTAM